MIDSPRSTSEDLPLPPPPPPPKKNPDISGNRTF